MENKCKCGNNKAKALTCVIGALHTLMQDPGFEEALRKELGANYEKALDRKWRDAKPCRVDTVWVKGDSTGGVVVKRERDSRWKRTVGKPRSGVEMLKEIMEREKVKE